MDEATRKLTRAWLIKARTDSSSRCFRKVYK